MITNNKNCNKNILLLLSYDLMKIYIEISKRKFITIDVKLTDTIKDVKQLIISKKGNLKDDFKLVLVESIRVNARLKIYQIFETELDDNKMVSKYKIEDETILSVF
jgi:hypothetical protein